MTGILKVSVEELKSTATAFESTGTQIKTLTTQMTSTIEELTGQVWSGEAATKYVTQFKGLQDDINKMIGFISEHVSDLQQMAQTYESAETTNETAAGGLSADVIV